MADGWNGLPPVIRGERFRSRLQTCLFILQYVRAPSALIRANPPVPLLLTACTLVVASVFLDHPASLTVILSDSVCCGDADWTPGHP